MKKRIVLVIAFVLAASIAFAACGSSPAPAATPVAQTDEANKQPQDAPASANAAPDPQPEQPADAGDEAADGSALSVYAAQMQEVLDAISDVYGDAMKIETSAQGESTLVITYTLLNDSLGLNAENIALSMETEGEKMASQAALMETGGIASPVIIVKWIDTDGTELFNQEYK